MSYVFNLPRFLLHSYQTTLYGNRSQQKRPILLCARNDSPQMALMMKTKVSNLPQTKPWNLIFSLLGSSGSHGLHSALPVHSHWKVGLKKPFWNGGSVFPEDFKP